MNGRPERYCPRCVGSGMIYDKVCPCVRRDTPIAKPIPCPGKCGMKVRPEADGRIGNHGSLGWSCDGKKVRRW